MLLVDLNDTGDCLTLAVNFDFWKRYLGSSRDNIDTVLSMKKLLDEQPMPPEFLAYINNELRKIVAGSFLINTDFASILGTYLSGVCDILYRGSTSTLNYFETTGEVCELVHDILLKSGINPDAEYNASFIFDKDQAKKVLSRYTEVVTASPNMALAAAEVDTMRRIYFFMKPWTANFKCDKMVAVSDIFHMVQLYGLFNEK